MGVTYGLNFNSVSVTSNTKLWLFSNTLFDNISKMLKRWSKLLHLIITKRNVISDVARIARDVDGFSELILGLVELLLLEEAASLRNHGFD